MTKSDIRRFLELGRELNAEIKLRTIPSAYVEHVDMLYGLYYGGGLSAQIDKNYIYIGVTEINLRVVSLDEATDKLYDYLNDDITKALFEALADLKWEPEEMKYLGRDKDKYETFKNKVYEHIRSQEERDNEQ